MNNEPARVEIVRDTYFGVTVEDPYRWLEDWTSPEAQAWLDAQAAYTRQLLDALPLHAELRARVAELNDANPRLYGFRLAGGRAFYLRLDPGENVARLVVRRSPEAGETVLVDPNMLAGEAHTAVDWFVPSLDGRRVAYCAQPQIAAFSYR